MESLFEFKGNKNPRIVSLKDPEISLKYYLTKKDLQDYQVFTEFINAVKSIVRKDPRYINYRSKLYELGLDHCQVFGNISSEMAELEMHHMIFSLLDVCAIVTDHMAEEEKRINSFIVADEVLSAHENHMIFIVILSETAHQAVECGDVFLPYKSGFGKLDQFIKKYHKGVRKEHSDTLKQYLKLSQKYNAVDNGVFELYEMVRKYVKKN